MDSLLFGFTGLVKNASLWNLYDNVEAINGAEVELLDAGGSVRASKTVAFSPSTEYPASETVEFDDSVYPILFRFRFL